MLGCFNSVLFFPTAICIILVHLLIRYRLHFLPESVAVVSLGKCLMAILYLKQ